MNPMERSALAIIGQCLIEVGEKGRVLNKVMKARYERAHREWVYDIDEISINRISLKERESGAKFYNEGGMLPSGNSYITHDAGNNNKIRVYTVKYDPLSIKGRDDRGNFEVKRSGNLIEIQCFTDDGRETYRKYFVNT